MEIKVRSILQQALDDLNTLASAKKDEEIYIGQMEAKAQALLEYITTLQRKEYNNSKAIEFINNLEKDYYKLQEDYEKLEILVELLYYKIELNDEQQELLDNILNSKGVE